ncbi:hypothetical protein OHB49_43055 (plasmid) [Streptomyces sp. NBC_01717]|uniref:hypothetical protein n=1 Tax=Streptomyces sp. NBC_01717 TaxID=2975918 RepID=UPI002E2F1337|nr:hypothetical protein [Streptomyces sp. NBC_01717]
MTTRLLVDAWAAQAATGIKVGAYRVSLHHDKLTHHAQDNAGRALIGFNEVAPHLWRILGCRRVVTACDACGMPLACAIRRVGNFSRKITRPGTLFDLHVPRSAEARLLAPLTKSTPAHNPSAEAAEAGE